MTPANDTPMNQPAQENAEVPFEAVTTPGCYVSRSTGNLYRIPAEALAFGGSPLLHTAFQAGSTVTKIAEDPWVPINRARQLCADADVHPSF
jgi:hypothetical protein